MDLLRELIIDNFAGGGGASCGIEKAIGRPVDIAVNHDQDAISMHEVNHPETEHFCESVWDVNPKQATRGQQVGVGWFSPDCTHFTKARGTKPKEKSIRGLAWVKMKWGATVGPRVMFLENVEEFQTWGPLLPNGMPDPKQKGRTFNSFVNALRRHKYEVEWRELRACDYGAPTIRKRLFMASRRDGKPIVWPEPTHGDPNSHAVKSGRLKPWRTAGEIIDWSIPCHSIFERKKPLVEKTLRRIARGIKKFIVENPNPYFAPVEFQCNDNRVHVAAFLAQYHSETSDDSARGQTLDRPLLTIDTSNRYALVTSHMIKMRGTNTGHRTDEPLHTITAGGNHHGEVRAFLVKYYGAGIGQDVNQPLHTIPTKDRFGLVTIHGEDYQIIDIGMRMLEPHELFAAQGFPEEYIIGVDKRGKKVPKSVQVARCGNSVPPQFSEALIKANCPELCRSVPYKGAHQLELQLV